MLAFCYIGILFGTVSEYLFVPKMINHAFTLSGVLVFFLALALRLWAIKSLGGRWDTLVLGKDKKYAASFVIVKSGPYHYIRHPIYLGAILESLSIPLVFNSYFTLGLAIMFYVPLLVLRAGLEEKKSLQVFGEPYFDYIRAVPKFLPFKKGKK
jgi:methyltransferase